MRRIISVTRKTLRQVRGIRVRANIKGTAEKPRLSVFRGLATISAQLIDDASGKTICQSRSKEVKNEKVEGLSGKTAQGFLVGKLLAERASAKGIKKAVFDRGGYKYHGRVAAVADGARAGGLEF